MPRRTLQEKPLDGDIGPKTDILHIEKAIASRGLRKDPSLKLEFPSKQLLGYAGGFTIYRVDSEWVRNNLTVMWGTGGHAFVHEMIPPHEIWVDPVSQPWEQIALHEAVEHFHMYEEGLDYREAHEKANAAESANRDVTPATLDAVLQRLGVVVGESKMSRVLAMLRDNPIIPIPLMDDEQEDILNG